MKEIEGDFIVLREQFYENPEECRHHVDIGGDIGGDIGEETGNCIHTTLYINPRENLYYSTNIQHLLLSKALLVQVKKKKTRRDTTP